MKAVAIAIIAVAIVIGAWVAGSNAVSSFKGSVATHAARVA